MCSENKTGAGASASVFSSVFFFALTCMLVTIGIANAAPSFSPSEGKIPLKVQFSLPGGESCDSVKWDFGDGNSSTAINPSYTYMKMGFFNPTCVCTLPGATITYMFDKIVPANADMSDEYSDALQYPTGTTPVIQTENLSLNDLIKQGTGLYSLGLFPEAASSYKKAIELSKAMNVNTPDTEILTMYGNILVALSRWDEAENAYNQSLSINKDSEVLNAYGGVLTKLKKYDEALAAFNQSRDMSADNFGAWAGTADVYMAMKKPVEAAAAYKSSLDANENQASVWKSYGDVLITLQKYPEAVSAYEKAMAQGISGSDIYYKYGEALRKVNREGDAQAALSKARSMQGPIYSSISDVTPICVTAGGAMG